MGHHTRASRLGIEALKKKAIRDREAKISEYYLDPKRCAYCNLVLEVPEGCNPSSLNGRKFCNKSCAAKKNNLGVRRNYNPVAHRVSLCNRCGVPAASPTSLYCLECRTIVRSEQGKNLLSNQSIDCRIDKIERLIGTPLSDRERGLVRGLPPESELWRLLCYKAYRSPLDREKDKLQSAVRSALVTRGHPDDIHASAFEELGYSSLDLFKWLSPYLNKSCTLCSQVVLSIETSHIDHIKPVSLSISYVELIESYRLENLQLLCGICNWNKCTH